MFLIVALETDAPNAFMSTQKAFGTFRHRASSFQFADARAPSRAGSHGVKTVAAGEEHAVSNGAKLKRARILKNAQRKG